MRIMVNGEWTEQPEGLTMAALLERLDLEPLRVAVERNRRLVRRAEFAQTLLTADDQLEIVTLVGGG
ncbi:MAG: sulfur carrier protein ThiS [Planctomycetaceae bacterium]|nr:sulfur carrier protein ThiS [Planctomycetaceae bacterium]